MESTPQSTSESIKTEDELVQVMSNLDVTGNPDLSKKADESPSTSNILNAPVLRLPKKRVNPSLPQPQQKEDTAEVSSRNLVFIIPDLFQDEETVNKRPKLSENEFYTEIPLSTSPAPIDQDSPNNQNSSIIHEEASDSDCSTEKMAKDECLNDSGEKLESADLQPKDSL